MQVPANLWHRLYRHIGMPFNLTGNLTKVHFGHNEAPGIPEKCKCMARERPDGSDPQKADLLIRVILEHLLDGTDWCAISDKDLISIWIDHIEIRKGIGR
jgi:hypothetical protein